MKSVATCADGDAEDAEDAPSFSGNELFFNNLFKPGTYIIDVGGGSGLNPSDLPAEECPENHINRKTIDGISEKATRK